MAVLHFVNETPSALMRKGLSVEQVVVRQAELLQQGASLWDYASWAYLYGQPKNPVLSKAVQSMPPAPKPAPAPKSKRSNGARDLHELLGVSKLIDLSKYIRKLSQRDRIMMNDYYFHGVSLRTIADRYGWTENTARAKVSQALKRLREVLVNGGVKCGSGRN